jgi:hypothetical protein
MMNRRFFHESCQFCLLRFSEDWNQRFFDSEFFFNELEPMVVAFPFSEPAVLINFQRTARHWYLPSSQLCHVSFAVSKFEVGERERERERDGRQKKDQNNIEERSAALANYTALDKNVMSCISNVMSCTEMRCQNQISHYYVAIHHPF